MNKIPEAIKDLQGLEIIRKKRRWKPFMEKYDCKVICELGVFEGENFNLMIEHKPDIAISIDSWINDGTISRNDLGESQEILNKRYWNFTNQMAEKPFVRIYRGYTFEAVKLFPDEYFDLIYIDADHTYKGCLKDIKDWYPKVKRGKFLIGDDYRIASSPRIGVKFGVIKAVTQFAKANSLKVHELPRYGWAIIK